MTNREQLIAELEQILDDLIRVVLAGLRRERSVKHGTIN